MKIDRKTGEVLECDYTCTKDAPWTDAIANQSSVPVRGVHPDAYRDYDDPKEKILDKGFGIFRCPNCKVSFIDHILDG